MHIVVVTSGFHPHIVGGVRGKPREREGTVVIYRKFTNLRKILVSKVKIEMVVSIARPTDVGGGPGHIRGSQMVRLLAPYGCGKNHGIALPCFIP